MLTRFSRMFKKSERRKDRRTPTTLKATLNNIEGSITDISLGGCGFFPNSKTQLEMGAEITMTLHLEDGDIYIPAKVVGHDNEYLVYGIAFLNVTPAIFDAIEHIIMKKLTPAK